MNNGRQTICRVALLGCIAVQAMVAQAAPDAARGEQVYARCLGCHALTSDRVGPRHCGLIGRRAASIAGFDYSKAMKQSGIVWDNKSLNLFLANPMGAVPGTSMTYDGMRLAVDREDLIAYLEKVNTEAVCKPGSRNKP